MDFKKSDFDNLLFRVNEVPAKVSVLSHFEKLGEHHEFNLELDGFEKDRSNIIKYIVYVYDRNSPFLRIEDIVKRKVQAALKAGFRAKIKNNRRQFKTEVDYMLKGYNQNVNKMIVRYCRMQKSKKYMILVAMEEGFWGSLDRALTRGTNDSQDDIKKRQQILFEEEKNANKIERLTLELLNEDNNRNLMDTLYEVVDEENKRKLRITPETRVIEDDDEDEDEEV
jgi:hypothetical protein